MKYVIRMFMMMLVSVPLYVFAATPSTGLIPCGNVGQPDCDFKMLLQLGNNLIKFCIILGTSVFTIMFMYAGFEYLTAMGDTGKISKAHTYFWNAIIGFVIMLSAWLLVTFILKMLLNSTTASDYLLLK